MKTAHPAHPGDRDPLRPERCLLPIRDQSDIAVESEVVRILDIHLQLALQRDATVSNPGAAQSEIVHRASEVVLQHSVLLIPTIRAIHGGPRIPRFEAEFPLGLCAGQMLGSLFYKLKPEQGNHRRGPPDDKIDEFETIGGKDCHRPRDDNPRHGLSPSFLMRRIRSPMVVLAPLKI